MPTKLILPLQYSGKMEVTPQQSEILQKELFKMGYCWSTTRETEVLHTDMPYIKWYDDKDIVFSQYALKDEQLIDFDNHFKIEE